MKREEGLINAIFFGLTRCWSNESLKTVLCMSSDSNYMEFIFRVGRRVHINGYQWDTFLALLVKRLKCDLNGSLVLGFIFFSEALDIVFHYKELKTLQSLLINLLEKCIFLAATMATSNLKWHWKRTELSCNG